MRLRRLAISLGMLGGLVGGAWLAAPSAARWYVEKHYPGVTIHGEVDVHLDRLVFTGVRVARTGLDATFDRVTVRRNESIEAEGGEATYLFGASPKDEREVTSRRITIKGLRKLTVRGSDYGMTLTGARYDGQELCFDTAEFDHPKLRGSAERGCAKKDKSEAWAAKVTTHLTTPIVIPEFPREGDLVVTDAHVWWTKEDQTLRASAKSITYGPLEAQEAALNHGEGETRAYAQKLVLSHPWLAPWPLDFNQGIEAVYRAGPDLKPRIDLVVNKLRLTIQPEDWSFQFADTCQGVIDALPPKLAEPLTGVQWKNGELVIEARAKDPVKVRIGHKCQAICSSPMLKALHGQFTYEVYDSKNQRVARKVGPGTLNWTPLPAVVKDMVTATMVMEDPGYLHHRGYIAQAFENSLKDNIKTGKFLRGGSTITMQLAKNLWLYRDKTLTRKLQELLLAVALESCFSKDQILELYLNVVEFGPDIYGIGAAARHYFKVDASALTPKQAFYLASILPRPRKAAPPTKDTMDRIEKLMKLLAKNGFIPETMLDAPDEGPDTSDWAQ